MYRIPVLGASTCRSCPLVCGHIEVHWQSVCLSSGHTWGKHVSGTFASRNDRMSMMWRQSNVPGKADFSRNMNKIAFQSHMLALSRQTLQALRPWRIQHESTWLSWFNHFLLFLVLYIIVSFFYITQAKAGENDWSFTDGPEHVAFPSLALHWGKFSCMLGPNWKP